MRLNSLMNSTGYARITMSPPDDMTPGGGGDDSGGQDENYFDDGIDESQDGNDDGLDENGEINLASDPDLKDFWNTGDEDDNSETPEQRSERLRNEERDMAAQLQQGLDSFAFADDLIPDDFNPADPGQMREVLASAIRQGASMTMQLMFKPVNKALQTHNQNLRDYVAQHTQQNDGNQRFESMLARAIPAVGDSLSGPMIKQLAETQRKRYPNDPQAAIRAVQKGMKAMGMSTQRGRTQGNVPAGSQSGPGMLDGFFSGLQRPTNRLGKPPKR